MSTTFRDSPEIKHEALAREACDTDGHGRAGRTVRLRQARVAVIRLAGHDARGAGAARAPPAIEARHYAPGEEALEDALTRSEADGDARLREVHREAALADAERGDGITVARCSMAAPPLADSRLVGLLQRFTRPSVPIQRVYPQARLVASTIRAFIDLAAPRLRARLGASLV